ncbi:MAG TPA: 2'-5' RNA ligase family protein [Bryobacteraceae bacterium]|nr:2'-5' RNA ligase family protein [Bryobacteraceae bacterium]
MSFMLCDPKPTDRINSYSLVSYIPGRLGEFITRLRQELVAGCVAQSHVTVLPPRPLAIEASIAEQRIRERVAGFAPFAVSIAQLKIFEQTSVVYAEIGRGGAELSSMHEMLNSGEFAFNEPFRYHPHITLAQNIEPANVQSVYELACRRWDEHNTATSFLVETLTFVQNTEGNHWIDLVECELRGEAAVPA